MKQNNIKLYALALADVIAKKISLQEEKKVIYNFLKLLEKNGKLKNAKKIISLTQKYYLEKTGNKSIILQTARKTITKNLLKSLYKEGDIIEEKINPALIAGIKIIINNEKQLDFSLKNKLDNIF
ncbi:MAG: hypothetical protein A3C58_03765 [Candidatus Staskawiczbacteria bacterium RIFCSPHIGHO2_02_FULL_34_10]|uniref:Uncharacterized protein n=1 Tax=Candidatus Staskawiczbacteria bacterium RIFCSPHIGHO2_02_FULL_34_10 TaxID=1802205 RepID=A0A1G2HY90_9BACT|nr:MAG: hypothetical protein A3C58_03765 [Candidatus Staskawiczbacteria bacterium RIFCSPHIGHO2_02_FULL_34_10]